MSSVPRLLKVCVQGMSDASVPSPERVSVSTVTSGKHSLQELALSQLVEDSSIWSVFDSGILLEIGRNLELLHSSPKFTLVWLLIWCKKGVMLSSASVLVLLHVECCLEACPGDIDFSDAASGG